MDSFLLEMKNIEKSFFGVEALAGVDFFVRRGSVHALVGENGAGKSTLMKILTGIYQMDDGEIIFEDKSIKISDSRTALKYGISFIQQELNPIIEMTVGENIFLRREPLKKYVRFVDFKKLYSDTQELFETLGIKSINPKARMKSLSIAQSQMVEIAKAVSRSSKLIIMDEPTSAISESEVQTLFNIIRDLKSKDIAIIYISHRLDEIFGICDYVTVMRDGYHISTNPIEELDKNKIISMMVGRELKDLFVKQKSKIGEVALETKNFTKAGLFYDISFKVHKGEILGVAGLMGAGRTEIVETLFGMHGSYSGKVLKYNRELKIKSERDAIQNGIVLATEDRRKLGLVLYMSVKHNISLANLKAFCKFLFIKSADETKKAREMVESLRIKINTLASHTQSLSGGNQQKVVLAKWLLTDPDILILDEPTRGIDVGAKAEIYKIMSELTARGKAIVMISSEMPELIAMSDRIIVIRDGRISGEIQGSEITQESILRLASA